MALVVDPPDVPPEFPPEDPPAEPLEPPEAPLLPPEPDGLPVAVVEAPELTAFVCWVGETLGRSYRV